jgi:hypothetical protein
MSNRSNVSILLAGLVFCLSSVSSAGQHSCGQENNNCEGDLALPVPTVGSGQSCFWVSDQEILAVVCIEGEVLPPSDVGAVGPGDF